MSTQIDRSTIRRTVRTTIESADDHPTRSKVVEATATLTDAPADAVRAELDELEKHGFVYLVGEDDPVVKLP